MNKLNEGNFLQIAFHNYDNPNCKSLSEFKCDLSRFFYLRKLLARYRKKNEINERLFLNHLIIIFNVFDSGAIPMLFYKIDKKDWGILSTFLHYIGRMPETIPGTNIKSTDLSLDTKIVNLLRSI